jgi:hypothetical protein
VKDGVSKRVGMEEKRRKGSMSVQYIGRYDNKKGE